MLNDQTLSLNGDIDFKIRFNTAHGDTDLYWRVIIGEKEYLVTEVKCLVSTFSDRSFDTNANAIKYHIAGHCSEFALDDHKVATFK